MPSPIPVRTDVHLGPDDIPRALRHDVREGLSAVPKEIPPKWFYDERGSDLFDQITRLPEYYPTRAEREILDARADDIASASRADTVIELGSGTSEKTHLLLDAFHRAGHLSRFVPFDLSEATLRAAAERIAATYPGVAVHAIVGDFERHLDTLPAGGSRMVVFLGGTIGNFAPPQRKDFFRVIADDLAPGDTLLLGTDLVKDAERLVAAYDDAAGVTAAFNKNVLHVMNRELDATFDPDLFDHVAIWDADQEWIEMRLRARAAHEVRIPALDLVVGFDAGEAMRTEISAKFRRERVEAELAEAGLLLEQWWTDAAGDFALSLARRA